MNFLKYLLNVFIKNFRQMNWHILWLFFPSHSAQALTDVLITIHIYKQVEFCDKPI